MDSKFQKIKQYIIIIIGVFILFVLSFQAFYTHQTNRINNLSELNSINDKKMSPKDLYLDAWRTIKTNYYSNDLNHQNWQRWKKRYLDKIETLDDAYVAINTMIASLDDSYSKFMSEEEFQEQNSAINSKLYGIGVNIASISGKIYVLNVLDGAPAMQSGIKAGDIILKVDDVDVNGKSIYQGAQLVRGDVNVNLNVEILRGSEKLTKVVKREEIKIKSIEYKKLDENIGYIRVSSFIGMNTPTDFIIALNKLQNTNGLILDLRGNSGGLFQNAIIISNLFLNKGTIVNVIARQGKKNTYSAESEGCIYNNPMVVLIDHNSASASEILASALHDNVRATLVGTRTYGKGLVQKVFSLPNKTGMNLTIARYLTPKFKDINKTGVEPDYFVVLNHSDIINNTDTQLDYAKNLLIKQQK